MPGAFWVLRKGCNRIEGASVRPAYRRTLREVCHGFIFTVIECKFIVMSDFRKKLPEHVVQMALEAGLYWEMFHSSRVRHQ